MKAVYEKLDDGKLVCQSEHPLPEEVLTASGQLKVGRYTIEFYQNNSPEDAKLRNIRMKNVPEDAVVLGSSTGIIVAIPTRY